MFEQLVSAALVGTGRARDEAAPAAGGKLGAAIGVLAKASPEARLLGEAAITTNYQRCGRKTMATDAKAEACEPDEWQACAARAAGILDQLLTAGTGVATSQIIAEWLQLAARARRRVAHKLLPALLDYAAAHRAVREPVLAVIDQRGKWLAGQNPRWQFGATGDDTDAAAIWETGSREQRAAALARLRETEPAKARQLVQTTWENDPADDRAAFLEKFRIGLTSDDEGFLEAALDDRSRQVRAVAAELLARLPGSKLVARAIARATPLLQFAPGEPGSVLRMKKARAGKQSVKLPTAYDKEMARDGVVEKPPSGTGEKQWWLEQIVGIVPPAHWSSAWAIAPEQCVLLASGAEYGKAVIGGWRRACERLRDGAWAEALLRHEFVTSAARLSRLLLAALPEDRFQILVEEWLKSDDATLETCSDIVNSGSASLGEPAARSLINRVASIVAKSNRQDLSAMWNLPHHVATRVPPTLVDEFTAAWGSGEGNWQHFRRQADDCLGILRLRRDLWKEFGAT